MSEVESKEKDIPLKIFVFAGFGQMMIEFLIAVFGTRIFDFYENEIGLATGTIAIAFIVYAVYNMFNDPLVGYLADKPRNYWKKYGKRYLWIVIGGILWALSFMLLFAVPDLDPNSDALFLFFWLLITICLYDTFNSAYDVNYNSLIPDKFRTDKQRMKLASFAVAFGVIGVVMGAILPPMLITYGDKASFFRMGVVVSIIGIIMLLLLIPGIKEDQEMIDRAFRVDAQKEQLGFFKMMKVALKQKSFVAYLCIFTFYQAMVILMFGSIPYVVRFILKEEAIVEAYIFLGYIVVGLISIPFWAKYAQKTGDFKKSFIIGGLLMVILAIPLIFVDTILTVIIAVAIFGVAGIGFWVMMLPVLSDVVDEAAVRNGVRQEGFYMGVRTFFGRIALIIQAVTFALIHILTGFEPGAATQSDTAIFGLRLQVAVVPMILMLIGVLLFWKLYDLTPEKKVEIKARLKELDL